MHSKFLLSVFVFVSINVCAQRITYEESSYKFKNGIPQNIFTLGGDTIGIFNLTVKAFNNKYFSLIRISASLNFIDEKKFPKTLEDAYPISLEKKGGKWILFYSTESDKTDIVKYFTQAINLNTFTPAGQPDFLFELKKSKLVFGHRFTYSEDMSKLLFLSTPDGDNTTTIAFALYDSIFHKLDENKFELPFPENKLSLEQEYITKSGKVLLLIKSYEKKQTIESRFDNENPDAFKYHLVIYDRSMKAPLIKTVDCGSKVLSNLVFVDEQNGNLRFFGTYQNSAKSYINGYFIYNDNGTGNEMKIDSFKEFPQTLLSNFTNARFGNSTGISKSFDLMSGLNRKKSGGHDFILEYRHTSQNVSNDVYFYNGYIIDLHLTNDDKAIFTLIKKLQIEKNNSYTNGFYTSIDKSDNVRFLFNDNPDLLDKYEDPKAIQLMYTGGAGDFAFVSVDTAGKQIKRTIDTPKDNYLFFPYSTFEIDDNHILIFLSAKQSGFSGDAMKLGLITIK